MSYEVFSTVCGHSMLLDHDKVMVINPRTDWRFRENPRVSALNIRFYASAPLLINDPDNPGNRVCIGRLVLSNQEEITEFGDEEADMLASIAEMAVEALEKEYQVALAARGAKIQHAITQLADYAWSSTNQAVAESSDDTTIQPHLELAKQVVDLIGDCLPGAGASLIDVTPYRLLSVGSSAKRRPSSREGSPKHSPEGNSCNTPWKLTPTRRNHAVISPESPTKSKSGTAVPLSFPNASNGSAMCHSDRYSRTSPSSFGGMLFDNDARSSDSGRPRSDSSSTDQSRNSGLVAGDYEARIHAEHQLSVFAHNGSRPYPDVVSDESREAIGRYLALWRSQRASSGLLLSGTSLAGLYLTTPVPEEAKQGSSPGSECKAFEHTLRAPRSQLPLRRNNPLASLTELGQMYLGLPIVVDQDDTQAVFLLLVTFEEHVVLEPVDLELIQACSRMIQSALLRQRARAADRAQLDFVRGIQHELRTPVNGIQGISSLLQTALAAPDGQVDTSSSGWLSGAVEGIRLASGAVSSILEDVLDFGELTGVRSAQDTVIRLDEVHLANVISEVAQDEVELAAIRLRHNARLAAAEGEILLPSGFFISVEDEVKGCFRVDRNGMRKAFRKLLHNAFRFSEKLPDRHGMVTVRIRPGHGKQSNGSSNSAETWVAFDFIDNGCGMDSAFVSRKYAKPFSKADTFTQGTGLGSAIASAMADRLGGFLDVQSEVGNGTRVTVTLPLIALPGAASEQKIRPPLRVTSVVFCGFIAERAYAQSIRKLIMDALDAQGIPEATDCPEQADLVVICISQLNSISDLPFTPRHDARIVIVTPDPLQRTRTFPCFEEHSIHFFMPPFGPSAVDEMCAFLSQEKTVILRTPPPPPCLKRASSSAPTKISSTSQSASTTPPADSPFDQIAQVSKASARPTESVEMPSKPFSVLAAEDNSTNMRILTTVLSRSKITYHEATDGHEAVEQFRRHRPDVVLLDISLPKADGFEVCRQIRLLESKDEDDGQQQQTPLGSQPILSAPSSSSSSSSSSGSDTASSSSEDDQFGYSKAPRRARVIAITALSSKGDQSKGLAQGMDEWRIKPLAPRVLAENLKTWKAQWEEDQPMSGD